VPCSALPPLPLPPLPPPPPPRLPPHGSAEAHTTLHLPCAQVGDIGFAKAYAKLGLYNDTLR
jgi:hypothetical protein